MKFPDSGRRNPAGTQTAARTSRLPATQLIKILQEKSFLSMQVQHLIKISFPRYELICPTSSVTRYFELTLTLLRPLQLLQQCPCSNSQELTDSECPIPTATSWCPPHAAWALSPSLFRLFPAMKHPHGGTRPGV